MIGIPGSPTGYPVTHTKSFVHLPLLRERSRQHEYPRGTGVSKRERTFWMVLTMPSCFALRMTFRTRSGRSLALDTSDFSASCRIIFSVPADMTDEAVSTESAASGQLWFRNLCYLCLTGFERLNNLFHRSLLFLFQRKIFHGSVSRILCW